MDTIKLLDNLEIGTPLVVTTTYQNIIRRKVTLYGGTQDPGVYNFLDDSGVYRMTAGYIRDHITISRELDQENDLCELAQLTNGVKREGVK